MLKYLFAFLIFIHGMIHLMGVAKSFGYGMNQITGEIPKPAGWFWLLTALLFLAATILLLLKKESWPLVAILAVIISQILIVAVWKDAKFGTIANIIVLITAIFAFAGKNLY